MRIAVTSVQVPFIRGGAEIMAQNLVQALLRHGHAAELITQPFRFSPIADVRRAMDWWATEDYTAFDCGPIDHVICLKFPSFYLRHPNKVIWLMHQHRSVYELRDTAYGESSKTPEAINFCAEVIKNDTSALHSARSVFTISSRVSERMRTYNGVASRPVLQPPANSDSFYCGDQLDYIFCPSRLETLKRQELLVRAMAHCRAPVAAIIAGEGGDGPRLQQLICELQLEDRVRLIGRIDDAAMRVWYANALGVFFGPFDEDYGFVTLEAMLSSKPVITCTDSGGPLDFVLDSETGLVVQPDAANVADAIEFLHANKRRAKEIGAAGLARYQSLGLSWDNVVDELLAEHSML
jgi:glycosyltransferase involved in cell wall biosynthesis